MQHLALCWSPAAVTAAAASASSTPAPAAPPAAPEGPPRGGRGLAATPGARHVQETPREVAAVRDLEFSILNRLQQEQDSRLRAVEEVKQLLESERAYRTLQLKEMCKRLLQGAPSTGSQPAAAATDGQSEVPREASTVLKQSREGSESLRGDFQEVLALQRSQSQQLQELQARQEQVLADLESRPGGGRQPSGEQRQQQRRAPAPPPIEVVREENDDSTQAPLPRDLVDLGNLEALVAAPLARLESRVEQLQKMMKEIVRTQVQTVQGKIKVANNHVSESYEEIELPLPSPSAACLAKGGRSSLISDGSSCSSVSWLAQHGHARLAKRGRARTEDSASELSRVGTSGVMSRMVTRATQAADWLDGRGRSGAEGGGLRRAERVVQSWAFEAAVGVLILGNAVYAGVAATWCMRNPGRPKPVAMLCADAAFLGVLAAELLLRAAAQGTKFLRGPDAGWHAWDVVLLVASTLKVAAGGHGYGWLRALRACKLPRSIRKASTMSFFRDLRLMIDCMIGSLKSLFWCSVLVLFTLYLFSLIFMQGFADVVDDLQRELEAGPPPPRDRRRLAAGEPPLAALPPEELLGLVQDGYGSVARAMLRLWSCATGGTHWNDEYDLISLCGHYHSLLFIGFIGLMLLLVWNVVTSVIVEKALRSAEPDLRRLLAEKRRRDGADVVRLFTALEEDGVKLVGKISRVEFLALMENTELAGFLEDRGVDAEDARAVFDLVAGEEGVDPTSFITTCLRIGGFATSIDLHTTHHQLMKAMQKCQLALQKV